MRGIILPQSIIDAILDGQPLLPFHKDLEPGVYGLINEGVVRAEVELGPGRQLSKSQIKKLKAEVGLTDEIFKGRSIFVYAIKAARGLEDQLVASQGAGDLVDYMAYAPQHAALFVDLDGTLRRSTGDLPFPRSASEVQILPGVAAALKFWRDRGYALLGVTNQSGIALGTITEEQFWDGYRAMQEQLGAGALDDVRVATGDVHSLERKPHPTLGWELAEQYQISLVHSFFAGDKDTDAWFAENLGLEFIPARNITAFEPPLVELPLVPFTRKLAKFQRDEDLTKLSMEDLVGAHFYAHSAHNRLASGECFGDWSSEDIEGYHDKVAAEFERRQIKHTSPLKGLPLPAFYLQQHIEAHTRSDETLHAKAVEGLLTLGLEHPGEDVDKSLDLLWVEKGGFLSIGSSGVEMSEDEVAVDQVLNAFSGKQALLRRPLVSLTGGVVNRKTTKGDVDIHLNYNADELGDRLDYLLKWRLLRALPPDIAKKVHFIHDGEDHGPIGPHVPLYSLALEPIPPEQIQMSLNKSASPGVFFRMAKPLRPSKESEAQTMDSFVQYFQGKQGPWEITKKYDGVHGQIHVGKKIYTEEGRDITAKLPSIMKTFEDVFPGAILDVEIEMWTGRTHLPRVQVAGYLSSKAVDDSRVVVTVFDIMHDGQKDVTGLPLSDRRQILATRPWPQSTMGIPSAGVNLAPVINVSGAEELGKNTKQISRMPGSEGVVAKLMSSVFPEGNETNDWVKYHKAAWVTAVVIEAIPTKNGAFTHRYGLVRGGKKMMNQPVKAGAYSVYELGRTFASKEKMTPGSLFTLEFETLNYVETDQGVEASLWAPRPVKNIAPKDAPDSVGAAMKIAESIGVLSGGSAEDRADLDLALTPALKSLPQISSGSYLQLSDEIFSLAPAVDAVALCQSFKDAGAICELPVGKSDGITSSSFPEGAALQPSQGYQENEEPSQWVSDWLKEHGVADNKLPRSKADETDLYLSNPSDDKVYRYVIQRHFRGKTEHMDLRMEHGQNYLIGWTIADLIQGAIAEPILTLDAARRVSQNAFKVDLGSGEFVTRPPQPGHDEGVRAEIIARRKKAIPPHWLEYEGVVPPRKEDPDSPGATKEYPGVYLIADKGEASFGAQKADFHEYFLTGKLQGRLIFRQLATDAIKRIVPAADADFRSELAWLCIQPEDQEPYVLSARAINQKWMPPQGVSALPPWVKERVPDDLRYWEEANPEKAREMRDALREQNLEFTKGQKEHEFRWSVQRQIYQGSLSVREGPTLTQWHLSLQNGRKEHFVGEGPNPFKSIEGSLILTDDYPWDKMFFEGVAPPGSELNDTKETRSLIRLWDHGHGEWIEDGSEHKKIRLDGESINGVFDLARTDAGTWRIRRDNA